MWRLSWCPQQRNKGNASLASPAWSGTVNMGQLTRLVLIQDNRGFLPFCHLLPKAEENELCSLLSQHPFSVLWIITASVSICREQESWHKLAPCSSRSACRDTEWRRDKTTQETQWLFTWGGEGRKSVSTLDAILYHWKNTQEHSQPVPCWKCSPLYPLHYSPIDKPWTANG